MQSLGVIAVVCGLALAWRLRPKPLPSPETVVYRDRFGIKFGEMKREQVEAAMRGNAP